jgi:monoamine oxidase
MARVVVIGAGAMGLAAGYHAAKAGHDVTVIEASPDAGGMAAHFDFAGMLIERFYHFVCKTDQPTFDLMAELGLGEAMRWRDTSMGYFAGGKLHRWGDPVSLLCYPHLSLIEKVRYGLLAFISTKRDRWDALETQSAREWITRWCGTSVSQGRGLPARRATPPARRATPVGAPHRSGPARPALPFRAPAQHLSWALLAHGPHGQTRSPDPACKCPSPRTCRCWSYRTAG